jgi:hypothetical protein
MFATNNNLKNAAVKAILVVCGLFVVAGSFGCDTYGGYYGGFDPSYLIAGSNDYAHDVMDWSAQSWSDVILYDDYIPYSTWDANDLTYPNY